MVREMLRAAGWLMGFAPADADDQAHIEGMIKATVKLCAQLPVIP